MIKPTGTLNTIKSKGFISKTEHAYTSSLTPILDNPSIATAASQIIDIFINAAANNPDIVDAGNETELNHILIKFVINAFINFKPVEIGKVLVSNVNEYIVAKYTVVITDIIINILEAAGFKNISSERLVIENEIFDLMNTPIIAIPLLKKEYLKEALDRVDEFYARGIQINRPEDALYYTINVIIKDITHEFFVRLEHVASHLSESTNIKKIFNIKTIKSISKAILSKMIDEKFYIDGIMRNRVVNIDNYLKKLRETIKDSKSTINEILKDINSTPINYSNATLGFQKYFVISNWVVSCIMSNMKKRDWKDIMLNSILTDESKLINKHLKLSDKYEDDVNIYAAARLSAISGIAALYMFSQMSIFDIMKAIKQYERSDLAQKLLYSLFSASVLTTGIVNLFNSIKEIRELIESDVNIESKFNNIKSIVLLLTENPIDYITIKKMDKILKENVLHTLISDMYDVIKFVADKNQNFQIVLNDYEFMMHHLYKHLHKLIYKTIDTVSNLSSLKDVAFSIIDTLEKSDVIKVVDVNNNEHKDKHVEFDNEFVKTVETHVNADNTKFTVITGKLKSGKSIFIDRLIQDIRNKRETTSYVIDMAKMDELFDKLKIISNMPTIKGLKPLIYSYRNYHIGEKNTFFEVAKKFLNKDVKDINLIEAVTETLSIVDYMLKVNVGGIKDSLSFNDIHPLVLFDVVMHVFNRYLDKNTNTEHYKQPPSKKTMLVIKDTHKIPDEKDKAGSKLNAMINMILDNIKLTKLLIESTQETVDNKFTNYVKSNINAVININPITEDNEKFVKDIVYHYTFKQHEKEYNMNNVENGQLINKIHDMIYSTIKKYIDNYFKNQDISQVNHYVNISKHVDVIITSKFSSYDKFIESMKTLHKSDVMKTINDIVKESVITVTGIRPSEIDLIDTYSSIKDKYETIRNSIKSRVFGQNEALDKILKRIKMYLFKLHNPDKPIGVYFMLGPTGVGKTETAKSVAEALFGSEKKIVRLDMSEFKEPHSVSKIIGAPPGYVGYNDSGNFASKVNEHKSCVILLDEFEKAHMSIQDIFLQVFDEGRLTDGRGNTIDMRNTFIFVTSNLFSKEIVEMIEKEYDADKIKHELIKKLKSVLRPEFINRLTDILFFNPIDTNLAIQIARKHFNKFREKFANRGYEIEIDDVVYEVVAEFLYDKTFGGRSVEREVEKIMEMILDTILKNDAYQCKIKVYVSEIKKNENIKLIVEMKNEDFNKRDVIELKPHIEKRENEPNPFVISFNDLMNDEEEK